MKHDTTPPPRTRRHLLSWLLWPAFLPALLFLLFASPAAHAAPALPASSYTLTSTALNCGSWNLCSGGVVTLTHGGADSNGPVLTANTTDTGQTATVTWTATGYGSTGARGLVLSLCQPGYTGSAGGNCSGGARSDYTNSGTPFRADGNITLTIPSAGSTWSIVAWNNSSASGDDITGLAITITEPVANLSYPTLNTSSLSTYMGNFWSFIAPALYIVAGIGLGGLIIGYVRHLF